MNKRDIVIGLVILAALAGIIFWRQRGRKNEEFKVPETLSVEDRIEEQFDIQIPEDAERAELKDVSGGNASAIATRKLENGRFEHNVLADLPEPPTGQFYEGWLVRGREGSEDLSVLSTGRMEMAKGGWMISFKSSNDLTDHNSVVITVEEKADLTPEKHILEGSF
jgi:hypothetical protein